MDLFIGVILILVAHFIADFVFQPHYIAISKSENVLNLVAHIVIYVFSFFIIFASSWYVMFYMFQTTIPANIWLQMTALILIINGILHYIIDYMTSQATKCFWNKKDYHNFFVVIGFDQLLHTGLLIYSYAEMLRNFNYI